MLRSEGNKNKNNKGQNISSTVTDAYGDLSGHKVSWANETKRNAREPRNERASEPVNSTSGSAKSAS